MFFTKFGIPETKKLRQNGVFTRLNGEHTAMVNGKGRGITDADLIATAAICGVPENKVRTMVAEVETAMKKF